MRIEDDPAWLIEAAAVKKLSYAGPERRRAERRRTPPDSMKPFLGWIVPSERRFHERRRITNPFQ